MSALRLLTDCAAHGVSLAAGSLWSVDEAAQWEDGVCTGSGVPPAVAQGLVVLGRAVWEEPRAAVEAPGTRSKGRWEAKD